MIKTRIVLSITSGPLKGLTHIAEAGEKCVLGRAADCEIQLLLPNDNRFANISRHHCEIQIEGIEASIRDLGSRNGTFLNDVRINQSGAYLETEPDRFPGEFVPLKDGDELLIGSTTVGVRLSQFDSVIERELASSV